MADVYNMARVYNWDAWSHHSLHTMIHGGLTISGAITGQQPGAGTAGAADAEHVWQRFNKLMRSAKERTDAALNRAGASWSGAASDSMHGGVTPLAQWAEDAHVAGIESASSVQSFGTAYGFTRDTMPEPVNITAEKPGFLFPGLFAAQLDRELQELQAQQAKAHAVELMTAFESYAGDAVSSVGYFTPPPSVVVDVPAPVVPSSTEVVQPPVSPGQPTPPPNPAQIQQNPAPPTSTPVAQQSPRPGTSVPAASTTPQGSAQPQPVRLQVTTQPPELSPNGIPIGVAPPGLGVGSRDGRQGGGRDSRSGPGVGRGVPGGGQGPAADQATGQPRTRAVSAGRPMAPGLPVATAGKPQQAEDIEHTPKTYLRDTHDDFWNGTPPTAPPVIGER